MFLCVKFHTPPPRNGISTRNYFISSLDLGSASKFTQEWYSFSNRSLKIALLQIYFNITKLFEEIWKKWPPLRRRPLSQSECRIQSPDNKSAATFWRRRPLSQSKCRIYSHNKTTCQSATQCWWSFTCWISHFWTICWVVQYQFFWVFFKWKLM